MTWTDVGGMSRPDWFARPPGTYAVSMRCFASDVAWQGYCSWSARLPPNSMHIRPTERYILMIGLYSYGRMQTIWGHSKSESCTGTNQNLRDSTVRYYKQFALGQTRYGRDRQSAPPSSFVSYDARLPVSGQTLSLPSPSQLAQLLHDSSKFFGNDMAECNAVMRHLL